jgi:hypothetical protein
LYDDQKNSSVPFGIFTTLEKAREHFDNLVKKAEGIAEKVKHGEGSSSDRRFYHYLASIAISKVEMDDFFENGLTVRMRCEEVVEKRVDPSYEDGEKDTKYKV